MKGRTTGQTTEQQWAGDPELIFTDAKGRPIEKPERKDFKNSVDFVRALQAYRDLITDTANKAFDSAFRRAMRS